MNKKIARQISLGLVVAGLGCASTGHANNWYVGAGLGYAKASASTGVGAINDAAPGRGNVRGGMSSREMLGALFAGYKVSCDSYSWFLQARGLMDSGSKLKRAYNLTIGVATPDIRLSAQRLGTLAFDVGVSKNFNNIDFSLQLSSFFSKYEIKLLDADTNFSKSGSQYIWGIAPGIGAEKAVGPVVIGLKYEYQIYAPLKYSCSDTSVNRYSYSVTTKPRYHFVMLSVKKEF